MRGASEEGASAGPKRRVYSITEVNALARAALERGVLELTLEGEVMDANLAPSGHLYFTLGDGRARLRGVMYRTDLGPVARGLAKGARVWARGRLTIYEPRGEFQLHALELALAGEGDRAAEVLRVRKRLAADGLLDPARKRPLPRHPQTVGVVTSRDGAALRDVVRVALARFPTRLVLAHTLVQGEEAPAQIVSALASIQRLRTLDVILLVRGGGGSEDLAAFDDERVARAVAKARVPIVTGVGHERDVSLADLVADVWAATPSQAAELAVPSMEVRRGELDDAIRALQRGFERAIDERRLELEAKARALRDPRGALRRPRATLLELERRLVTLGRRRVAGERARLARLDARLSPFEPRAHLAHDRARLLALAGRLAHAMALGVERSRRALAMHARALDALSPLAVLERGYAVATLEPSGALLRDADEAPVGATLRVRLARGVVRAAVLAREPEGSRGP